MSAEQNKGCRNTQERSEVENRKLRAFSIYVGFAYRVATYWLAAYDELGAIEAWITASREGQFEGATEEVTTFGIQVDPIPEERAPHTFARGDTSVADLLDQCEGPSFLAAFDY